MTQIATVKQIKKNGMVEVEVKRKTACGHDCSQCAGGCTQVVTGETVVTVHNELDAKRGDVVLVESQSSQILAAAMIVYLLPFLLFFLCYFAAGAALGMIGGSLPIVCGLIGFALGIATAIFWDRREGRKRNFQFRIIEIKQRCSDM